MTKFVLFLDDVGAEFTKARSNRKEVIAAARGKLLRFTPTAVRPLEVIDPKSSAKRAAGGFLLLGPVGAALGLLSAKGATVLFELECPDGVPRKGVIAQDEYSLLRREIESMQTYREGDFGRNLVTATVFLLLLIFMVGGTGPAGLLLAPLIWFGGAALLGSLRRKEPAA